MEGADRLGGLISEIREGRVVLFLGAGASVAAGAPSSSELAEQLAERFLHRSADGKDLTGVANDIAVSMAASPSERDFFVRDRLKGLQPSPYHLAIPRFRWPAIYTSNFDDLVEKSYEQATDPVQTHREICASTDRKSILDDSLVHIFHVAGSIRRVGTENHFLVLSVEDLQLSEERRESMLRLLGEYSDSTVLFVGYSFYDLVMSAFLKKTTREAGLPGRRPGFVVLPSLDEKTRRYFAGLNVIPIEMTFEQFMDLLCTEPSSPAQLEEPLTLKVLDGERNVVNRSIEPAQAKRMEREFWYLHEGTATSVPPDLDVLDFYRGETQRAAYYHPDVNADFRRAVYGKVFDRLKRSLQKSGALRHNRVFSLLADPGNGRTVLLNRLAYDVYARAHYPVVFLRSTVPSYDLRLLEQFCKMVQSKVLIIAEDLPDGGKAVHRLYQALTSRSVSVDLILSSTYEDIDLAIPTIRGLEALVDEYDVVSWGMMIRPRDQYELTDSLDERERERLAQKLAALPIPKLRTMQVHEITSAIKQFDSNFFASMLVLLDRENVYFEDIVRREYHGLAEREETIAGACAVCARINAGESVGEGLEVECSQFLCGFDSNAQLAYTLICAFEAFGIQVNWSILRRLLDHDAASFSRLVTEVMGRIVRIEQRRAGERFLTSRHPVIARWVYDNLVADRRGLFLFLMAYGSWVYPDIELEADFFHQVRVGNRLQRALGLELLQQFYLLAVQMCPSDLVLMHHLAIAEMKSGALDTAQARLEGLLDLQPRNVAFAHTLGVVLQRKARKALAEGRGAQDVDHMFDRSQRLFEDIITHDPTSRYGYDGYCGLIHTRARHVDIQRRSAIIAAALPVVERGIGQVDSVDRATLRTWKQKLYQLLGREDELLREYQSTREQAGQRGHVDYLHAVLLYTRGEASQAASLTEECLRVKPHHRGLKRLLVRCWQRVDPSWREKSKAYLGDLYAEDDKDLWVALQLGVTHFMEGNFEAAAHCFARTDELSQRAVERHKVRARFTAAGGRQRRFHGEIRRSTHERLGQVYITDLYREVPYDRRSQRFHDRDAGTHVSCHIAFTYQGPRAVDVKRLDT